ncbi:MULTISPECIES: hypothetical protein [Clostridium]|uniref:hypothetical protein n=1 Tax=Clostridium TaxID=1485 RepID=UPI00035BB01B|nr:MULTISPECIES: hypothetical protein [Clostridium]APR02665.1 hypothetical protein RSJ2_3737 [Clostridium botulinum]AUM93662.1 hypothetical protein RSJ11_00110 [Clostridium sporogenes]AUN19845.1 hypothetical protein B2M06_20095 [Clostridium botulinum]EPS54477.1 hypothetical protein CLQ_14358 [Clostridium botulinum Af84]KEI84115.1 hypothetical protein N493_19670 [Clostridium botulinum B2 433]
MKIALIYDNKDQDFSIFIDNENVINTDDDIVANELFNELRMLSNNCDNNLLQKKEVILSAALYNTK